MWSVVSKRLGQATIKENEVSNPVKIKCPVIDQEEVILLVTSV